MSDLSHTFYHIFSAAWRRRYALLTPILLMPIAGFLVAQTSEKNYQSHTSMLIQETSKMNPFLEDFSVSALLKERMTTLSTLLHSRHILNNVALKMGLITATTSQQYKDEITTMLSASLDVHMQGKDLIRIEIKSNKTEGMKQTLEIVSEQFIEQLLTPERSSMTGSMRFLKSQLTLKRDDIETAEKKLAHFKNKHAEQLPELFTRYISRLSSLKQKRSETQAAYAGANNNLGSINAQLLKTDPIVAKLEQQIINTQNNIAVLRARYTDKHSKIQNALKTLKSLESERQKRMNIDSKRMSSDINSHQDIFNLVTNFEHLNNLDQSPLLIAQLQRFQSSRNNVNRLKEGIKSLTLMITALEEKASSFGELESTLSKLERDLTVKRDFYDDLLQRYEMAKVTGALSSFEQNKRIKIIDRPFTPTHSSNLPTLLFVIAGFFGGIFLGIGLAILLEITDNSIRYKSQIELMTKAPYLGCISAF